jgi:hypothetical protein
LIFGSGEDETAEENPESQEMLEEQLVRMLTREVMDLISKWHVGTMGSENFPGKRAARLAIPTKARLMQRFRFAAKLSG